MAIKLVCVWVPAGLSTQASDCASLPGYYGPDGTAGSACPPNAYCPAGSPGYVTCAPRAGRGGEGGGGGDWMFAAAAQMCACGFGRGHVSEGVRSMSGRLPAGGLNPRGRLVCV